MIRLSSDPAFPAWRESLARAYRADEDSVVAGLIEDARLAPAAQARVHDRARTLVAAVRANRAKGSGIDAFMSEYDLSTQEGLTLMCLAEALLRVPDPDTADSLIRDKLSATDWEQHLGHSRSIFVNASTLGLMLTGRVLGPADLPDDAPTGVMRRLVARLGEPVIRQAMRQAMRIMGRQFVLGRTIKEAMERGRSEEAKGYRYSFDMLGEAARTDADALAYFESYTKAIHAIGKAARGKGVEAGPGISVKLSALHPRYEPGKRALMLDVLVKRTLELAQLAAQYDIGFCVDAEEAERLELSLEVIEAVYADPSLGTWTGFGLAVQAYQKRTREVIDILADMVRRVGRRMNVRLVKGAYWDAEIKRSQDLGLDDYPVYTRKTASDVSYLACAKRLFAAGDLFFPQFATHNAHTAASVLELSQGRPFEFQRLHGMGEDLYDEIVPAETLGIPCRIYAPVGGHAELLSYLVRRLLENGANTSFVNRLVDDQTPIESIIADPVERLAALPAKRHPNIALPVALYGADRRNSRGVDLSDSVILEPLAREMTAALTEPAVSGPIIGGDLRNRRAVEVRDPADRRRLAGYVTEATAEDANEALARAEAAFADWAATPPADRAARLDRVADLMEDHMAALMALCVREAGKTLGDAVAEVREAVDFLRYYANRTRADIDAPVSLPDVGGRACQVRLSGRGVFVCISPWNFPLAIFTGQITAALGAGNTVIAKPAEQTPLIAAAAVRLFHEAGIPGDVLQLLPGQGETIGAQLVADARVKGVAFTGSVDVAHIINKTLAERGSLPLIAETGGMNAMIVDSSALPEQVIRDVLISAFGSAGQRCSALRVLYLQDDVADGTISMLKGAMEALTVGDPSLLSTDVGPVIDDEARSVLQAHAERMDREARLIGTVPVPNEAQAHGCFFAPRAYEIKTIKQLEREVFGPILHVIRYPAGQLDTIIKAVRDTGYGLTMGIHTRIDSRARALQAKSCIGNTYVNRTMIGAVVGVQPFGGEGLSGTGPKAGGPHYIARFAQTLWDPTAEAATEASAAPSGPVIATSGRETSLTQALSTAAIAAPAWRKQPVQTRTTRLETLADHVAKLGAGAQGCADPLRRLAAQVRETMSKPVVLPGPTGEHNELQHHARGLVLVVADDQASVPQVLAHIGAALGAGNTVVAVAAPALTAGLAPLVKDLIKDLIKDLGTDGAFVLVTGDLDSAQAAATDARVTAVAVSGGATTRSTLAKALAARPGAIIPLIDEPFGPHLLDRFIVERTLTIDITAAGGNASLLTLNEDTPPAA